MILIMEKRPYIGVSTLFVGLAKLLKAVARRGGILIRHAKLSRNFVVHLVSRQLVDSDSGDSVCHICAAGGGRGWVGDILSILR